MVEIAQRLTTQSCIIGAGLAGMMLALLLARAGVNVIVLEKHADYLHDFRGDMIHPATFEVMHDLGMLDGLLQLPHQRIARFTGAVGSRCVPLADFSRLHARCPFIAFMPQWDFLAFLEAQARRHSGFALRMRTQAVGLLQEGSRVVGVRAHGPNGSIEIRADLVVGADGRQSKVRAWAGFSVEDLGSDIDVLWMRVSRRPDDAAESLRHIDAGQIFVLIDRGSYWQCALVIPKGAFPLIRQQGLAALRERIATLVPSLCDRLDELRTWDDVRLLAVAINRLPRWYRDGLLCLGDAAHAMSPVTGVGINLAIQDAVAAANILAGPLRRGTLSTRDLARVERRRKLPTRLMQFLQRRVHEGVIAHVMASKGTLRVPLALELLARAPPLRHMLGRIIGLGFRPERLQPVDSEPAASATSAYARPG